MEKKVRNLIYIENNIAYQKCYSFEKEQVLSNKIDLTSNVSTTFLWQLNNIAEHATNGCHYIPDFYGFPIIFSSKGIIQVDEFSDFDFVALSELKLIKQKANDSIIKNRDRMIHLCEELFPYMNYESIFDNEVLEQEDELDYLMEKHQEICKGDITVSNEDFAEFYDVYSAVLQPLKPYDYEERIEAIKKKYSK